MADGKRVLFLCTGNSCRSQMAEGLLRHRSGHRFDVWSAGTERHGLNPDAVRVMQEIGIDISAHECKTLEDLPDLAFDYVATVCDRAKESCPVLPGSAVVIHRSFDDPPALAAAAATDDEALQHYRRVRDEIAAWCAELADRIR